MGIELFDSDNLITDNFFQECKNHIINSDAANENGRWKMIGGCDSLLLQFAEKTNCDMIATNDGGFKGTKSLMVRPLIIREVY
ncbi:MAG: hypothetical protein OEM77_04515 [Nitrosopumilus sp.]|nr:hypothetical protein [Nitrosopumilus sp.]MDH3736749.1 hypothetical protein [Nitrosopumilus sp.]MDH3823104.1 hypothetical protein [Nitrosopumilus sp.]MDH3834273.1 hypothetical protein [Nitrosopumilus sp.]